MEREISQFGILPGLFYGFYDEKLIFRKIVLYFNKSIQ